MVKNPGGLGRAAGPRGHMSIKTLRRALLAVLMICVLSPSAVAQASARTDRLEAGIGLVQRAAIAWPFVMVEDDILKQGAQGRCFAVWLIHLWASPFCVHVEILI